MPWTQRIGVVYWINLLLIQQLMEAMQIFYFQGRYLHQLNMSNKWLLGTICIA